MERNGINSIIIQHHLWQTHDIMSGIFSRPSSVLQCVALWVGLQYDNLFIMLMTIYNAFWELIWPDMILHNLLCSKVSKVGWCFRMVARNVRMIVRYGFNVNWAYWDGLQVGCRSTDKSIWDMSCNTNLKPGGCSGIAFESSWALATPLVC